ncbi:MAG: PAS domain-containing protein, partial [Pseudomonadales bacterium]|nr:PAS domain-containing protein [Pseudomonadales bacterium]
MSESLLRADLTPSAFALSVAWLATIAEDPLQRRLPLSHASIIASIRQPILVTDSSGRIVMSNPSAAALLDRTSEDLEGRDAHVLLPFDALSERANGTYQMYARGEARIVEARIAPVQDRWRQLLGWIIQLVDRTEETRLEQATERAVVALAARADALEDAGKAKTSFLATVSHELRTPLGAIIGFAELVKDGMAGALTDAERETAIEIHETGTDLLRQVNSLLDLEKSEAGALGLRADS